ncbi:MAG: hypothetical protein IPN29_14735 [Saprospiraceae bacterium]|nr:hypothetical protein [Saprospiraceae bacterium]
MNKKLFMLAFLLVGFVSTYAQKTLNKGMITMEITEVTSPDEQTAMMLEMMKGSQTEVYFDGTKHASKMSMMGGMVEVKTYVNQDSKSMDMLMDMMGQKMWIASNLDEMAKDEQAQKAASAKVEYDKSKKKEILGYNCYAMTVTLPDAGDMKLTGFVTEDIKTDANIIQGMQSIKFQGFPIEYTVENPMMKMTMTAVAIKDTLDVSKLEAKTDGYNKMTMAEFKAKMGNMGGGFGF